jgi:competence protein ComEA
VDRGRALLVLVLVAVAVLAGARFGARSVPEAPPPPVVVVEPSSSDGTLTIHVSGWVLHPGLVKLDSGSRVADAVAAAGGALPGADLASVNLAELVLDGQQIVVPGPDGGEGSGGSGNPAGDGVVHINKAGVDELQALPGVGPVLADRIVTYRDEHGPFKSIEDLLDVPGIGEAKLAGFRDLVAIP